ncbi:hypothetical protein AAZX31_04G110500 [Glycine max]
MSASEREYVRGRERVNVRERERENVRERDKVRESFNAFERNTVRERKKEVVQSEAGDSEWKTVKSRRSRYLRTQTHGGKGRWQQRTRRNWRDDVDITSFYFTRFSEEVTKAELWRHFSHWGELKEIFIPNRRNREGKRYGFARFKGVGDRRSVEKELDNSFIRGLKLHVNIPKYGRGDMMKEPLRHRLVGERVDMTENIRLGEAPRRATVYKTTNRSYAEVAALPIQRSNQSSRENNLFAGGDTSSTTLSLDISEEDKARYKNVWVGRLKKLEVFERLDEEVAWHVGPSISAKYLGDDMALLLGLSDKRAAEIIGEETEQSSSLFYSLTKWNPQLRMDTRLVWLRCWGIPILGWKTEYIRKMVAAVGDMVDIDEDVEHMQRLYRARVLVRTPWPPLVHHTTRVLIDGVSYCIYIVEENGGIEPNGCRHDRSLWASSEEIISDVDDDDMATVRSWSTALPPTTAVGELGGEKAHHRHDPQPDPLTTGFINEPVGNDPPNRLMVSKSTSDTVESLKRKQFEWGTEKQLPDNVTFNEKSMDSEALGERFPQIIKADSSPFDCDSEKSLYEEEEAPKSGQHVEFTSHGSHTPPYGYSEAHNHIGPSTINTPEAKLNETHQQHQEISKGLQVYTRKKWYKKKEAQQDSLTELNSALLEKEKEAITERQRELLYQMGLTHGGDPQQFLGLMADLEQRDNDMAAEKGVDRCTNDNTLI